MPPFSDEPVTIPFIPTLEDEGLGGPPLHVPPPRDYGRPVIPTEEDYEPVILADPSPFYPLRLYRYRPKRGGWKHIPSTGREAESRMSRTLPSSVRIATWNVLYMRTVWDDRMNGIIRHLEKVLESHDGRGDNDGYAGDACVVLLQEVTPQMLELLLEDPWVQQKFAVAPNNAKKWPDSAYFGNVTLVSRDIEVVKAQILHFSLSANQRTGILVYLRMARPGDEGTSRVICIANTHLESHERMRSKQLEVLVHMVEKESPGGGVIAGDLNASKKSDRSLARKLGLRDAWRRGDSDPEGFTWGYQSLEEDKNPPARLDKILYLPQRKYKVDEPIRIGVGLKVTAREGEDHWASEHYGLLTTLRVTG